MDASRVLSVWLERRSRAAIGALSLLLVGLFGLFDAWTGYEASFSIFYLAPVSLAAWYAGRAEGTVTAAVSAVTWMAADLASGHPYTYPATPVWNALVRFGFFLITARLLSRLRAQLRAEEELARVDALTGSLNRRAFLEEAQRQLDLAARNGAPTTLVYLDVDGFKSINDSLGHAEGDLLLKSIAMTLRQAVRRYDLVCRIGGDEFALCLPGAGSPGAERVLGDMRQDLIESFRRHGWPVTCSIGAVIYPTSPPGIEQALEEADRVMYGVKNAGKDGVAHQIGPSDRPGASGPAVPDEAVAGVDRRPRPDILRGPDGGVR